MKKSTRVLILAAVVEFGLLGLMLYLIAQIKSGAMQLAMPAADASARIGSVLGTAMGVFLVICLLLFLSLRKKGL